MDYLAPKKKYTMDEIRQQIQSMPTTIDEDIQKGKWSNVADKLKEAARQFAGSPEEPRSFQVDDQMPPDSHDALGYVYRKVGQIAAEKAEKEMFDYLSKAMDNESSVVMPHSQGRVLTKEAFQDAVNHMMNKGRSTPTQTPKNDLGPLTAKYEKRSPMLRDIMVMRQFTELGNPVDKSRLYEMADDARYEVFDTEWLLRKYEQNTKFLEWSNPGVLFIAVDTRVSKSYTYAPNKKEFAVYANGYIVRDKSSASSISGTFPAPGSVTRGKRGIVGQSALDAIKLQILASQNTGVVIQKPMSFDSEFKDPPMVLESTFTAKPISIPEEMLNDLKMRSGLDFEETLSELDDVIVDSVTEDEDGNVHVEISARKIEPVQQIITTVSLSEGEVNKNGRIYPESSINHGESESSSRE